MSSEAESREPEDREPEDREAGLSELQRPEPPLAGPERAAPVSYELELPDGSLETLAPGANLALIGSGALACVQSFADERRAAVVLADTEDPLLGGRAVADQIADALPGTRRAAGDRATDLLELTGMPEPHLRVLAHPHQLSPLDRQRAQLALVLANGPALVVAEDPCAGLDPTAATTFAATLHRLWSRLGFTLVTTAAEPADARRAAEQILVLDEDGAVRERQRRRHNGADAGSDHSSSST